MSLDRFDCYELCVQSPRHVVTFLRALGDAAQIPATVLREDFCGTASVARRWVEEGERRGEAWQALAIDNDEATIAKARELIKHAVNEGQLHPSRVPSLAVGDCIHSQVQKNDGCDIIFVGNFSIGYIDSRKELVQYLRNCKRRLNLGNAGFGGGCFVCDIYGGASAFRLGALQRTHPGRRKEIIHYTWLHEEADPRTARVQNSISFRVVIDGDVVQELPRAFVYQWRLWSLAELREAMLEAGFSRVEVYKDINVAPGQRVKAVEAPQELGEEWVVCVVGW